MNARYLWAVLTLALVAVAATGVQAGGIFSSNKYKICRQGGTEFHFCKLCCEREFGMAMAWRRTVDVGVCTCQPKP